MKMTYIAEKLKNPKAANYYVVIDDNPDDLVMEVRRSLYNGQNQKRII